MINGFSMQRSEQINLAITIVVVAVSLSPFIILQNVEPDPLTKRDAVVYDSASFVASFFVVLIPLADLLLDFPSRISAFFRSKKGHRKAKTTNSVVIRLTDTERFLFIIGVAVQSTIGFLPPSTSLSTIDIVHNCTGNLSVILTLGPILTFLQRCTVTFTGLKCIIVLSIAAVGLCTISISNFFRSRSAYQPIIYCGSFILVTSWIIYLVIISICAVKYCRQKFCSLSDRQACFRWVTSPLKSMKEVRGKKDLSEDNDNELYTNYIPALHMISSITIASANAYVSYTPNLNSTASYEMKNYVVLIAEILVLVIELRIRKNEIARGLVSSAAILFLFLHVLLLNNRFLIDTITAINRIPFSFFAYLRSRCWSQRNRTCGTSHTSSVPRSTQHSWDSSCLVVSLRKARTRRISSDMTHCAMSICHAPQPLIF